MDARCAVWPFIIVSLLLLAAALDTSLVAQCDNAAAKAELQKLSDSLRFSDPVSSDATAESEAELRHMLEELQTALVDGDFAGIGGLCK